MNREQFAHIIRAASDISGQRDIIVFGSQAILGAMSERRLPAAAWVSNEVDLVLDGQPGGAEVEGIMGLDSSFHKLHGIYADVVGINTSKLPRGWRRRLIPFENDQTQPGRGLCLERHDLAVAKLIAGRDKDLAFVSALYDQRLLSASTMARRLEFVDGATKAQLERARAWVAARRPTTQPKP